MDAWRIAVVVQRHNTRSRPLTTVPHGHLHDDAMTGTGGGGGGDGGGDDAPLVVVTSRPPRARKRATWYDKWVWFSPFGRAATPPSRPSPRSPLPPPPAPSSPTAVECIWLSSTRVFSPGARAEVYLAEGVARFARSRLAPGPSRSAGRRRISEAPTAMASLSDATNAGCSRSSRPRLKI